jgi:hypothetical protein
LNLFGYQQASTLDVGNANLAAGLWQARISAKRRRFRKWQPR